MHGRNGGDYSRTHYRLDDMIGKLEKLYTETLEAKRAH